jgi:hypothetical protein
MVQQGTNAFLIRQHLGHRSFDSTLAYVNPSDARIRPMDLKHPVILPIGHEVVMKMKKVPMLVRVPDGDKKMREYEVVGMEPAAPQTENASTKPASP